MEIRIRQPLEEEGELKDPRRRSNSLEPKVKETRIRSKPGRNKSFKNDQTDFVPQPVFVAPPDLEVMYFDKPTEDEQLTQTAISKKLKRSKLDANMSAEDDLKEIYKKAKMREDNDMMHVRFGDYHTGYRNKDLASLRKRIETHKLESTDVGKIMLQTVLEKGDTSRIGISTEDRHRFLAYILFLNAGSCEKTMEGTWMPEEAKGIWDEKTLRLWGRLTQEEKKEVTDKY